MQTAVFTVLSTWLYVATAIEFRRFFWWIPVDHPTWAVSPPVGCDDHNNHRHLLLLLSPKADSRSTAQDGRLSRPRHCSKGVQVVPKAPRHSSLPVVTRTPTTVNTAGVDPGICLTPLSINQSINALLISRSERNGVHREDVRNN